MYQLLRTYRKGSVERAVIYDGELFFDGKIWPVMIREFSGYQREGNQWSSFQRQCRWGRLLQYEEGFVRMYGSFDAEYRLGASIPTICALDSCPMALCELLIDRATEQNSSDANLNVYESLNFVFCMVKSVSPNVS